MAIELKMVCFFLAMVLLVLASIPRRLIVDDRVRYVAGGLVLYVLPFLWDAVEATF